MKKKIRALKKQEILIRGDNRKLVWDTYFKGKYSIEKLETSSDDARKRIIEDYFISVYMLYYRENGISIDRFLDPALLQVFGLPSYATMEDVKKRFRELAMEHHPDHGGDINIFRYYMDVYEEIKQV